MLWKLLILLYCRKGRDYVKGIQTKQGYFIVRMERFVPIEVRMKRVKKALAGARANFKDTYPFE